MHRVLTLRYSCVIATAESGLSWQPIIYGRMEVEKEKMFVGCTFCGSVGVAVTCVFPHVSVWETESWQEKKKPSLLFYSMHVLAFKNALMCWTLMCPTISVSCLACSLALVKAALCVPAHEWLNWVPVRAADCWALTLTHTMIILAADIMVLLCYH